MRYTRATLHALSKGQRLAFLEIANGELDLSQGVRVTGMYAPEPLQDKHGTRYRPWDFSRTKDQEQCRTLVETLDPVVFHVELPGGNFSKLYSKKEPTDVESKDLAFKVDLAVSRTTPGRASSMSAPQSSSVWKTMTLRGAVGTREVPRHP